jgi:hypothetical protein
MDGSTLSKKSEGEESKEKGNSNGKNGEYIGRNDDCDG